MILVWQYADEWGNVDVKLHRLRKRCEQIAAEVEIPTPFDIQRLCDLLGERRGRPIHLMPIRLPALTVCGMYVPTGDFDAIFYEQDTSPLHQLLIIGHELGHLLAGHHATTALDPDASRLLLPDLDPQLVQRSLGRSNYAAAEEREAEMIGSLLLRRARAGHEAEPDSPLDDRHTELYGRLRRSLEHPDW
ncbi:ImmA/IrrE family metallo-endopeptidase [Micromonospora sp. WMMD975]|uniref:ImmA/IrrE family metallo-endopeptidase n=1 Tax=Micromonospora sp. WMMD975 TaxID=3016087 RepID=UPI00249B1D71|nr:ImmA/IrrE family metallo-endopeptidase [Micromonospora sp. WMMD975]WFE36458.1 ImmA/IrrE family metallo-endopeptidase [Micromonospora sp. WMMD975]